MPRKQADLEALFYCEEIPMKQLFTFVIRTLTEWKRREDQALNVDGYIAGDFKIRPTAVMKEKSIDMRSQKNRGRTECENLKKMIYTSF